MAEDFNALNGSILIAFSKNRKSRHVYLTAEGQAFFQELAAGLEPTAPLFRRTQYGRKDRRNSGEWTCPEMTRTMRMVCDAAKTPRVVFHELRQTYASMRVNAGVPMLFVAQQMGHANTRQVEKHHGHLCKNSEFGCLSLSEKITWFSDDVSLIDSLLTEIHPYPGMLSHEVPLLAWFNYGRLAKHHCRTRHLH